jgi:hypothetical protein
VSAAWAALAHCPCTVVGAYRLHKKRSPGRSSSTPGRRRRPPDCSEEHTVHGSNGAERASMSLPRGSTCRPSQAAPAHSPDRRFRSQSSEQLATSTRRASTRNQASQATLPAARCCVSQGPRHAALGRRGKGQPQSSRNWGQSFRIWAQTAWMAGVGLVHDAVGAQCSGSAPAATPRRQGWH